MILCSILKNVLCKIVTKSQVVTKFNVTKSRLHCINLGQKNRKMENLTGQNSAHKSSPVRLIRDFLIWSNICSRHGK